MTHTEHRIHELANYVGAAYTAGTIDSNHAHHIISELTLILSAVRFAERDHAAELRDAAREIGGLERDLASEHARAEGYY